MVSFSQFHFWIVCCQYVNLVSCGFANLISSGSFFLGRGVFFRIFCGDEHGVPNKISFVFSFSISVPFISCSCLMCWLGPFSISLFFYFSFLPDGPAGTSTTRFGREERAVVLVWFLILWGDKWSLPLKHDRSFGVLYVPFICRGSSSLSSLLGLEHVSSVAIGFCQTLLLYLSR